MRKKVVAFLTTVVFVLFVGCAAHTHVIGSGAKGGGEKVSAKQWYALFGLIPLNKVDTKQMAGDASDYTITTKQDITDILLGMVVSVVTLGTRTVTVEK